jgi:hypothetical protein
LETRSSLARLAALGATEDQREEEVLFLILTSGTTPGRVTIVAPVQPDDLSREDVRWRVGMCLLDAEERLARETNSTPSIGVISGSLAAEFTSGQVAPDLAEVALREAWEARPLLAMGSLRLVTVSVPEVDLPFQKTPPHGLPTTKPVIATDIRNVAFRLGLSLIDTLAAARRSGLPVLEDTIDAGVEESLRKLLKLEPRNTPQRPPTAPSPSASTIGTATILPGSPQDIASRMLAKLVRDKRFGSNATARDNVCSHRFADNEKAIAKKLLSKLIKRGILLSRDGRARISINPDRMVDVKQLIAHTFSDLSLFEDAD